MADEFGIIGRQCIISWKPSRVVRHCFSKKNKIWDQQPPIDFCRDFLADFLLVEPGSAVLVFYDP